jgi:site-specific recombinase XerD
MKGNRQRILPLPTEIRDVLEKYLHLERPLTNACSLFVFLKGRHRGQPLSAAGLRTLFRHHRLRSRIPHANPHRVCAEVIWAFGDLPERRTGQRSGLGPG